MNRVDWMFMAFAGWGILAFVVGKRIGGEEGQRFMKSSFESEARARNEAKEAASRASRLEGLMERMFDVSAHHVPAWRELADEVLLEGAGSDAMLEKIEAHLKHEEGSCPSALPN